MKHGRRVAQIEGATYGWRGQNNGRVYSVCGSGEYQSMIKWKREKCR